MRAWLALIALPSLLAACGDNDGSSTTSFFDLTGATTDADSFWNHPFPSDLRLTAAGSPDLTGFPNRRNTPMMNGLLATAGVRQAWPLMSIGYFRFTAAVPDRAIGDVIVPADDAPALLIDIDPSSPELGTKYPIVAQTLAADPYISSNLVALAPRPGIVLRPLTKYAYVIRTAFAPGFAPPDGLADLAAGRTPSGTLGATAATLYAPLWTALDAASIARTDVIAATVFTTGDEIARTRKRTEALRTQFHPQITDLVLSGGSTYDGFCVLHGSVTMPQFQIGTPPFDTGGTLMLDANDIPQRQVDMTIPVVITLPKAAMPATGWPLYQFFHGSGGLSTGLVDLGRSPDSSDNPEPGKGPGYVVALHGIAAASSALPLNPERLPSASDYEYLNVSNLAAFPSTFQQGIYEQRLLLDSLLALQIPQSLVDACGIPAPASGMHTFDPAKLVAGGQSMGGMYTNMIGSVEGRYGAFVPTGAGGFWNLMILETAIIPGVRSLLGAALGVDDTTLVFVHPALDMMALGWEIAEPIAAMSRIADRPLPGLTARHVYEPVGMGDSYFATDVYDAAALAYGNQEAPTMQWPTMQDALNLDGLGGLVPYPVKGNRSGMTRVVVQYQGDGIIDPHYIYRQLDAVKHQYGCFLESYLRDGIPTVPAPGALTDPCD